MGEIFMNMLPYALGIMISPVPIITGILILFSSRARSNGVSYLLGWAVGIGIPAIVVLALALSQPGDLQAPPSRMTSILRIAVGLLFMALALRNWRQRKKPDDPEQKPMLLQLVDSVTPVKAWLIGFLFADVTNPKNMALTMAGCLEISSSGASPAVLGLMLLLFVAIASAGVAAPLFLYLLGGESSKHIVAIWKQWLVLHKKTVMSALFILFVLGMVYKGVAGLLGP
jgi:hypothetical protein